ncbi:unnamed protein product, partial [Cylicocyclus nassatus]
GIQTSTHASEKTFQVNTKGRKLCIWKRRIRCKVMGFADNKDIWKPSLDSLQIGADFMWNAHFD